MPPPPSSTLPAMQPGNLWFGTLSGATGRSSLRSESDWGVGLPMAKAGVAGVIHTPLCPCGGLSHLENCSQWGNLRQRQEVRDLQPELCSRLDLCMSWQGLFGILGCLFCFVSLCLLQNGCKILKFPDARRECPLGLCPSTAHTHPSPTPQLRRRIFLLCQSHPGSDPALLQRI